MRRTKKEGAGAASQPATIDLDTESTTAQAESTIDLDAESKTAAPSRRSMLAALGAAATLGGAVGLSSSLVDGSSAGASVAPGWKDSVRAATP